MNVTLESVRLRNGGLYLSAGLYDRCFRGLEAVVLVRRADELLVFPVRHTAAGGYLLKLRNSVGDRVVFAPDFFGDNGLSAAADRELAARWNTSEAILVVPRAFAN